MSSAAGVSPATSRGVHRLADADADRMDAATDLAGAERTAEHAKDAYDAAVAEAAAASAAVDAEIGRAHVRTPVTRGSRMPSSA